MIASGIRSEIIDAAGIYDDPGDRGWIFPWSDGWRTVEVLVYDRDKRPTDDKGRPIKNRGPNGETTFLNALRVVAGSDQALIVEGVRQQLAAASYAPEHISLYGMNGCDGIHGKLADWLAAELAGKHVGIMFDADWRTNERVNGAATKRVPGHLLSAGAASVHVVSVGGVGTDGLDDVLKRTVPAERAALVRQMLKHTIRVTGNGATEGSDAGERRTQAILDAAHDAADLEHLPESEPLLSGLLNVSEYTILVGKFGTYKSFTALAWSYALATGQSWSGHPVPKPRPVVYVAAEGMTGIRKRIRALERRYGVKVPRGMLTVVTRPVRLANPDEVTGLRAVIERTGAALVVLDTWHRMTPGIEENSATDTGGPLDALLSLRDDYGASVLLVHHTGHMQLHGRGSSALEDDADAAWMIRLGNSDEAENRGREVPRTLVHRKAKDGEIAAPIVLRLDVDDAGAVVEADPFTSPALPTGKRGRPAKAGDHEAAVLELIEAMDKAEVPVELGERKVREWDAGRRPGRSATRDAVREAIAARRATRGQLTAPKSAAPLEGVGGAPSAEGAPESPPENFRAPSEQGEQSLAQGARESRPGVSAHPARESRQGVSAHPDSCPKCVDNDPFADVSPCGHRASAT